MAFDVTQAIRTIGDSLEGDGYQIDVRLRCGRLLENMVVVETTPNLLVLEPFTGEESDVTKRIYVSPNAIDTIQITE